MNRKRAGDFEPQVLELYDDYAHGRIDRRQYIKQLGAFAVGGLTIEALIASLHPNYAWAQQIEPDDLPKFFFTFS